MDNRTDQAELVVAIRDLIAQLQAPRVSSADELWTAEDIARYIKLAVDTTERRVVTRPDFPASLQPCLTGARAAKRWFAAEVIRWARQSRCKIPNPRNRVKGGAQ